jgi:hypothetical protein
MWPSLASGERSWAARHLACDGALLRPLDVVLFVASLFAVLGVAPLVALFLLHLGPHRCHIRIDARGDLVDGGLGERDAGTVRREMGDTLGGALQAAASNLDDNKSRLGFKHLSD